ncbi:MAG: glycosyl transferase family 2 [Flavobacteriaceae bacterium]|nr:glycosyl transferase family 2 [Flavobacteriaceae bacterium]
MKSAPKITALAITLNEASIIEKFIESLWFVEEIIIVDSHSTDDTVALAEKYDKVTVLQRSFDNFSAQKNFAISRASHDWVVFFDPDEEITHALAHEIINIVKKPNAIAYFVKRDFMFMGKRIRYSGFQSDWVVRLFDKKHCKYNDNLVHEVLETDGPTGKLKHSAPHHTYKSFDHYTGKLHRYSALQAKMLYRKKKKPTAYHFFFRPFYRFFNQYILRLGILDGKEGFILAYVHSFSVFKRYLQLWLRYRRIS